MTGVLDEKTVASLLSHMTDLFICRSAEKKEFSSSPADERVKFIDEQ